MTTYLSKRLNESEATSGMVNSRLSKILTFLPFQTYVNENSFIKMFIGIISIHKLPSRIELLNVAGHNPESMQTLDN